MNNSATLFLLATLPSTLSSSRGTLRRETVSVCGMFGVGSADVSFEVGNSPTN